jgi:chromosome partitioning protein
VKTKIISIMTQKGGAGKSTLTNSVILDLSMKQLLKTKKQPRVLVVDADSQSSIYKRRHKEQERIWLADQYLTAAESSEGKKFLELSAELQSEAMELRKQLSAMHQVTGWDCLNSYDIVKIDMGNVGESLRAAMAAIDSNNYDYAFIDMPGSLYQEGTSELLELIEHLIIPVDISFFSEDSAEEFTSILNDLELSQRFKTLKFVSNKYKILQAKQSELVERELTAKTRIPFMETRVKHATILESRAYNTVIPLNYRVNLNTAKITHNERQSNIGEFATELLKIVNQ